MKEKVPKIVEKFIIETSMTTRGPKDRNANSDEVILINEDQVELAIMLSLKIPAYGWKNKVIWQY